MNHQILYRTKSLCPECLDRIPAEYREIGGKVYLYKECEKHGKYQTLFWNDAELFHKWTAQSVHANKIQEGSKIEAGCPFDCGLCKKHEGGVCTAVLEITYRCNLTCRICFADTTKADYEPTIDEIRQMYETAYQYGGNCSIQLSGGEPTVRDDIFDILKIGKSMGFHHIQVNTNGLKIALDLEYLHQLKEAGADLIYLQFDGTNDSIYKEIRDTELIDIKIKAIENCRKAGIGVLLVPTIIPGINLDNIGEMVRFAKSYMPVVKGIHFQPVSYFGRYFSEIPSDESRCSLTDVMHALENQSNGEIKIKDLVPRKRHDAHCAFSSLFYLPESGTLKAITEEEQNESLTGSTDFAKKTNHFTNTHWRISSKVNEKTRHAAMEQFKQRLKEYTLTITGMGFQDVWNIDTGRLRGCCVHVISNQKQAIPLCAFHVTSRTGERLYKNE